MAEEKCPRNLAKFTISHCTGIFKFMRPRLREWYQSISEIVLYKVEEKIFQTSTRLQKRNSKSSNFSPQHLNRGGNLQSPVLSTKTECSVHGGTNHWKIGCMNHGGTWCDAVVSRFTADRAPTCRPLAIAALSRPSCRRRSAR